MPNQILSLEAAVQTLREQGYVIVMWEPSELDGLTPTDKRHLAAQVAEYGADVIEQLREGD